MFVNLHLNGMPPRISPHLGSKFMLLEPINTADMIPSLIFTSVSRGPTGPSGWLFQPTTEIHPLTWTLKK
jgi:hypothetical protein